MAIHRSFGKITLPLSHLPTWFFILGYPCYWLQLYTHTASQGVTSILPWLMWGALAIVSLREAIIRNEARPLMGMRHLLRQDAFFWAVGFTLAVIILGLGLLASFKPIHLMQEFDCLQYHYTLPRQHLILGSFAHIPWSADDLYLLPMEFALAPFWFASTLPNKIPQFFIFLGLIAVAVRLSDVLATQRRPWVGPGVALLILATHGFGIQLGTGMLDLAIAYLFLAALDSLRLGHWFIAGVEMTFFFWSKPLMPVEMVISAGILIVFYLLAVQNHWQIGDTFKFKNWRKAVRLFLILSVFVAGPFLLKSIEYAKTPLFPMSPGLLGQGAVIEKNPPAWLSLQKSSQLIIDCKNSYGYGRDLEALIKHWWLLAVPLHGVNNAFDYPLGLSYLLMIGPFLFFLCSDIWHRQFKPLNILVALMWILWWFSSQQSRFLYLPLLIIFIGTLPRFERMSKVLCSCILISLVLCVFSLWGAHHKDLGRWGNDAVRDQDKQILELNRQYFQARSTQYIVLFTSDAAFAQFPVMIRKENLPHIISCTIGK